VVLVNLRNRMPWGWFLCVWFPPRKIKYPNCPECRSELPLLCMWTSRRTAKLHVSVEIVFVLIFKPLIRMIHMIYHWIRIESLQLWFFKLFANSLWFKINFKYTKVQFSKFLYFRAVVCVIFPNHLSVWCIWYTIGKIWKLHNLFMFTLFPNSVLFKTNLKYTKRSFFRFVIFSTIFCNFFKLELQFMWMICRWKEGD
jgi:hypothetical protein